jgi:uncharacterized protein (DUF1778 family)
VSIAGPMRMERLEARVPLADKELLQQAAALEGTTLSDFVRRSAHQAAVRAIQEHQSLTLTLRESQAFIEAVTNPPAPNDALRTAAARYQQVMGDGG